LTAQSEKLCLIAFCVNEAQASAGLSANFVRNIVIMLRYFGEIVRVFVMCSVCSVGCPAGSYESSPCSNFADRVCVG